MIREQIKSALESRNGSVRKMCLDIGIRKDSVYEYLNGKRENISIDKLEKIFKYLSIELIVNKKIMVMSKNKSEIA